MEIDFAKYDEMMENTKSKTKSLILGTHPWIEPFVKAGAYIFGGFVMNAVITSIDSQFNLENYLHSADIDVLFPTKNIKDAYQTIGEIVGFENIKVVQHCDYGVESSAHYHVRAVNVPILFDITVILDTNDVTKMNPRFSVENLALSANTSPSTETFPTEYVLDLLYTCSNCSSVEQAIRHVYERRLVVVEPSKMNYKSSAIKFISRTLRKLDSGWKLSNDLITNRVHVQRLGDSLDLRYEEKSLETDPRFYALATRLDIQSTRHYISSGASVQHYIDEYSILHDFPFWLSTHDVSSYTNSLGMIMEYHPELIMKIADNAKPDSNDTNIALYALAKCDREEEFQTLLSKTPIEKVIADTKYGSSTVIKALEEGANIKYYKLLVEAGFKNPKYDSVQRMLMKGDIETLKYLEGITCVGTGGGYYALGKRDVPKRGVQCVVEKNMIISCACSSSVDVIQYVSDKYPMTRYELIKMCDGSKIEDLTAILQILRKHTPPDQPNPEVWRITSRVIKTHDFDLIGEYVDYLIEKISDRELKIARLREIKYFIGTGGSCRPLLGHFYEYFRHQYPVIKWFVKRFPDFIPSDHDLMEKVNRYGRQTIDPETLAKMIDDLKK